MTKFLKWWLLLAVSTFAVHAQNPFADVTLDNANATPAAAGGDYVKKDEATTENDQEDVGNISNRQEIGTSWTTGSAYTIRRIAVKLFKVGSPTFTLTAEIHADNGSGLPSGTPLCTSSTVVDSSTLTGSAVTTYFDFDTGSALSDTTKYHIVLDSSAIGDESNYVRYRINFNGASGQKITAFNGTVWSQTYDNSQAWLETYAFE
jgi:hypothetical protein